MPSANGGNDHLYGGNGADKLDGGLGVDWLYGDAGNDILYFGGYADHHYAGRHLGSLSASVPSPGRRQIMVFAYLGSRPRRPNNVVFRPVFYPAN